MQKKQPFAADTGLGEHLPFGAIDRRAGKSFHQQCVGKPEKMAAQGRGQPDRRPDSWELGQSADNRCLLRARESARRLLPRLVTS